MACARRVEAQDAGPPHRRVRGFARQAGLSALAANPRATHPPRQGDLQHLHRAGAACGDGFDVCRLSWAGGTQAHRRTPPTPARRNSRRRSSPVEWWSRTGRFSTRSSRRFPEWRMPSSRSPPPPGSTSGGSMRIISGFRSMKLRRGLMSFRFAARSRSARKRSKRARWLGPRRSPATLISSPRKSSTAITRRRRCCAI